MINILSGHLPVPHRWPRKQSDEFYAFHQIYSDIFSAGPAVKVPITSKRLFSYLILCIIQRISAKKNFVLHKTRSHNRGRSRKVAVLMIWGNFLFIEQIAPSRAAHARACCEDFCRCSEQERASEIPGISDVFGPQLNTFRSVGICLSIFVVRCSNLSGIEFRYVPLLYITDQVVFGFLFYKNSTLLHSKFQIC